MPQNPMTATHFVRADFGPPGEHGDGSRQGSGAATDQAEHTIRATNTSIIARHNVLRTSSERAAERVIETAANAAELVIWFAAFRAALWLAFGVSNG